MFLMTLYQVIKPQQPDDANFCRVFPKVFKCSYCREQFIERTENTIMSVINGLAFDPFPKPR